MKNSEETIEKVLAGLRNSDAPPGMERRILNAVQNHASAQPRSGWRNLRSIWSITQTPPVIKKSVAYGVAMAGIFVLVLAIPAIHWLGHPPIAKRNAARLPSLPPAPSAEVAESVPRPVAASNVRSRGEANVRRVAHARTGDSLALREMRAPSRPEPPMPLTEQEKLLVRYVQTRSPEELAAINPVKWAARDAEERSEFERFFGQSTNRGNE